ncbi:SHD1 domain-containing protein [Rhodopirellula sp. P2]|uniref:SHD1 domain-containing protein n=1 Tax=Rhodopirellula sp. P2 TaxID=2127060 RepID=UPI0023679667|nr:SHD1 domain-containing protein [Rhodopirellula sp. P2]WDQ16832.1 SHD1 domain-containing protein [Rhodopirellula sp. P2]
MTHRLKRPKEILVGTLLLGGLLVGSLLTVSAATAADPARFSNQVGESVTYKINIQIGIGKDAGKYPGSLTYHVKSATPELIQLTVTGDLQGKFSRPSSFFRSSNDSPLPTLESVSCRGALLGITPLGEVEVAQRDEMLGLLLGTIGQLAIAPLPPADAAPVNARAANNGADVAVTWDVSDTTTIARVSSPFGMTPSFASRAGINNKKLSIATEKWKYVAHPAARNRMKIDHQYELSAPESDPPLKMQGEGIAFFNLDDGFYEQMQINRMLFQVEDGVEVKIPVSIALVRETQQERDAKIAAAKEAALKRTRPFTDAERKQWVQALAPGSSAVVAHRAMTELNSRNQRQDPVLAQALLKRAETSDNNMKSFYYSAAARYDESIKQMAEDRRDYSRGVGTVKRTGAPVTTASRLVVGQILAKSRERFSGHEAVEVTEIHDRNEVSVRSVGGHGRVERVNVSLLRYPPDTVPQPVHTRPEPRARRVAPKPRVVMEEPEEFDEMDAIRTWTDKTGKFKIEASFLAVEDEKVRLKSADDKTIEVPLAALSKKDADLAEQFQKESEAPANPFQVVTE